MSSFRAFPAIRDVLAVIWGELPAVIRIGWAWMLVLTAAQMLLAGGLFLHGALPVLALWLIFPARWLEAPLAAHLLHALGLLAYASFSVNWHRHLLRGESVEWRHLLRLDWPVWMVLLYMLPLLAAVLAADSAAKYLAGPITFLNGSHWSIPLLLSIPPFTICLVLLHRVAIMLPAAALGRTNYVYATAWQDSRGRPFQLAVFLFLVVAGIGLGAWVVSLVLFQILPYVIHAPVATDLTRAVTVLLLTWIPFVLTATCHAVLYASFAEGREA